MITLFLFDLGKVFVDFDFAIAFKRLQKMYPLSYTKVIRLFRNSNLAENWDKGLMTGKVFFETIRKEIEFPGKQKEFMAIWNEIFSVNEPMVKLARGLKKRKGSKVMFLSNTNPWHADYLRKNYSWLNEFDGFIASCDVRLMKPDPKIYKVALARARVEPKHTFYLDDLPENVEAARALGIDALIFKDIAHLAIALAERGFPTSIDDE